MRRRRVLLLSCYAVLVAACESRSSPPFPAAAATLAPAASAAPIVVDVYTDLVCPWCYIGTERLDRAIVASGLERRVEVRHHAFLLSPETPEEGTDVSAYLRAKTGRDPKEMFGRVEAVARESGLALDLSKQPRLYATARGHALLRRAPSAQAQRNLERALFRAYFVEGVDLTSRAALVRIAVANGFEEASARAIVDDEAALHAVREEARLASRKGVRGVPHFSFPGGRTLSGAQSEAALRAALIAAATPSTEAAEKRGDPRE